MSKEMLNNASVNAKKYEVDISLLQADFRELDQNFTRKFDSVICLGNSLLHIFLKEDIIKSLRNMFNLINENRLLIIEMRDYDELVNDKIRFFP